MKNSTLKAPAHLRPDTRTWWQSVHQDYDLEEHHSRLLIIECPLGFRLHQNRFPTVIHECPTKGGVELVGPASLHHRLASYSLSPSCLALSSQQGQATAGVSFSHSLASASACAMLPASSAPREKTSKSKLRPQSALLSRLGSFAMLLAMRRASSSVSTLAI